MASPNALRQSAGNRCMAGDDVHLCGAYFVTTSLPGCKIVCQSFFTIFSLAVRDSYFADLAVSLMPEKPFGADLETLLRLRSGSAGSSGQIPFI